MTIRKHCATDKTPSARSLVDVVGSQTDRKTKRDGHGLCKLVGLSSRKLASVHWSVLFARSSSTLATVFVSVPSRKLIPVVLPASPLLLTHTHTLTHPWCLRLHPESELLSTFSVGWAALPP